MTGRSYLGARRPGLCEIRVREGGGSRQLPLRLDLVRHSPTGFEWGYGGSGPAQLALAILADASGDSELALRFYQRFKREVVARLKPSGWELPADFVLGWLEAERRMLAEHGAGLHGGRFDSACPACSEGGDPPMGGAC